MRRVDGIVKADKGSVGETTGAGIRHTIKTGHVTHWKAWQTSGAGVISPSLRGMVLAVLEPKERRGAWRRERDRGMYGGVSNSSLYIVGLSPWGDGFLVPRRIPGRVSHPIPGVV